MILDLKERIESISDCQGWHCVKSNHPHVLWILKHNSRTSMRLNVDYDVYNIALTNKDNLMQYEYVQAQANFLNMQDAINCLYVLDFLVNG